MKNTLYIFLLAALAFSCKKEECPPGYTGNDCSEEVQPKKITVSSISVIAWPATDALGQPWDFGSDADLYIKVIRYADNAVVFTSNTVNEAAFSVSWNVSIEYKPDDLFYVEVWDDDGGFSENDFMGICLLPGWAPGAGFPELVTLQMDGTKILYTVKYEH